MKNLLLLLVLFMGQLLYPQSVLLDEIDKNDTANVAYAAFKGLKIVNFESTKMVNK